MSKTPEEGQVKAYYVKDYEPEILKNPYLDDAALNEIFEIQLQNYLIGQAPWAANFLESDSQSGFSFKDILKFLLTDWIKTAIKKLIGEIFIEFQSQQDSFTDTLKPYIFDNLQEAEKTGIKELFPTEEDKKGFIALKIKELMALSVLITDDEQVLNDLIFQPGNEFISSISVRKRFQKAITTTHKPGQGSSGEGQGKLKEKMEITNLILNTITKGLALKLKELGEELKNRKRVRSAHIQEENFLSNQDKNILIKYLSEGLPIDLLEGLSPLDRTVLEYENPSSKWRNIDQDWLRSAEILALKLDSVRNNTSLVLAIELVDSGKVLLFPGDAQAGNWRSWSGVEYEENKKKVKAEELLEKTVFYKVGHHGSHNATMNKNGLDLMKNNELAAMIPVDQHVADKVGWEMPFAPLLEALLEKTNGKVAIADAKMDISRMLAQLPEEHRTEELKNHLETLKEKWESASSAFTPSKKELTFNYKVKNKSGKTQTVKVKRPLYFEYTVG